MGYCQQCGHVGESAFDCDCRPFVDEPCSTCGGQLYLLGVLGRRRWARCRDCGHDQTVTDE